MLYTYIACSLLALNPVVEAISTAPIETLLSAAGGNRTTLKTQISPPWVSTSGERGTSDILWSCLLTLTACVYTAIHLNVPPAHETRFQFFMRKAKWVALALFAPEIVLYCALTQLLEAQRFVKEMNELWEAQRISPNDSGGQKPSLASPDRSESNSKDVSNSVEQGRVAPDTPQDQTPCEVLSPPALDVSTPESESLKKEDNTLPISNPDYDDRAPNQPSERSPSTSSQNAVHDLSKSKEDDIEKAAIALPPKKFSFKYGLFVVMGGIVTRDTAKLNNDFTGHLTLTPNAIIQFARSGTFLDVPLELISDKSKSNLLGKGLVCIQVTWFLIQCIARAAAGYPLALLEVHTMVHVVCALLMYALWWEKPQDISEPAIQDVSNDLGILALLTLKSSLVATDRSSIDPWYLAWYGQKPAQDASPVKLSNEVQSSGHELNDPEYEVKIMMETDCSRVLKSFDRSKGQVVALVPGQALRNGIGPCTDSLESNRILYLSAKDVYLWQKLAEGLNKLEQKNESMKSRLRFSENSDANQSLWVKLKSDLILPNNLLSTHVSDLPGDPTVSRDRDFWIDAVGFVLDSKMLSALLILLPLVYGGIHLTTWNFDFASHSELLLWKIACIDIMATMPMALASVLLDFVFSFHDNGLTVMEYVWWILFCPLFLCYALSRIYIVVESLISLRHVPIGVYAAIPWVQDIPHV